MKSGPFTDADAEFAKAQLTAMGLRVTFGRHVMECNEHLTAPISSRVEDLHAAFIDPSVKGVLAVTGGIGAIQILDQLDYGLIASHPKVLCGYSDIAHVSNAILAKTGLVTYYGPNFGTFMMRKGGEYTRRWFHECLFESQGLRAAPASEWSDDAWAKDQDNRTFLPNEGYWAVQPGTAEGTVIGGSAYCLNMLQGSDYFPWVADTILFLESPGEGKASLISLDCALRALSFQPFFEGVRAIVLGRYPRSAGVNRDNLAGAIRSNPAMARLPVIGNCDFGHTTPVMTIPIGGRCRVRVAQEQAEITFDMNE